MEHLRRIFASSEISIYKVEERVEGLERYIVSTPYTRAICNCPEIYGCKYTDLLRMAVTTAMKSLPFFPELINTTKQEAFCILHLLRGGLNFGLRKALHLSYGLNRQSSAFLSSQREEKDGKWEIKDDNYRKLYFLPNSVLLIGDVAATGTTLDHSLELLLQYLKAHKVSVKNIVFFTIGCEKTEEVFRKHNPIFFKTFPGYQGCHIVYFEGRFKLVEKDTKVRLGKAGTDFVRFDCLLAPEFELSQYDALTYPLEKCTIYDAGSRACEIETYLHEVQSYWHEVDQYAKAGLTLHDALKERWPETEYQERGLFLERKETQWQNVPKEFLERIYAAYCQRWSEAFRKEAGTSQALSNLCQEHQQKLTRSAEEPAKAPATPLVYVESTHISSSDSDACAIGNTSNNIIR